MRVIAHLDMDAFFASYEQRETPEYRGKPVIVGGSAESRGVVSTCSYEARKFGVRSAMPTKTALKLCPEGIFVRPRGEAYRAESAEILKILRESSPIVEQVSVDEAYFDLSAYFENDRRPYDRVLESAGEIARGIQSRIAAERQLTCSIGVASNMMLAKIASDLRKPNAIAVIPESQKAQILRPLSTRALSGVGPVTAEALAVTGIVTIGDIQDAQTDLSEVVGSFGPVLRDMAMGIDEREIELDGERKSISSETTFPRDTAQRDVLRSTLRELSRDVAQTLDREACNALTVVVKVRYGNFKTLTRQIRLADPLDGADEIYRAACFILAKEKLVSRPLRLLGVGVATLVPPNPQLRLRF